MTTTQSAENLTNGEENDTTFTNPAFDSQDDVTKTDDVPKTDDDGPEKREEEVVIEVFTVYDEPQDQKDEADEDSNCCSLAVTNVQTRFAEFYHEHHDYIWLFVFVVLVVAYGCYLAGALWYRFGDNASIQLLVMTCVLIVLTAIAIINWTLGDQIYKVMIKPLVDFFCHTKRGKKVGMVLKWILLVIVIVLIILFLVLGVGMVNSYNLVSFGGLAAYVLLCFIFSKNPAAVKWRPVIFGILLQFILGLIILKTRWGYQTFEWIGEKIKDFLDYADAGSKFVFGDKTYTNHFFAFKVLPVIVYFSTVISMLYYLGWMQVVIRKMSWVMQVTMGTTAGESLNAAGNIFVGQSEAPLMIRPLIKDMTKSELHAIMTGGFATIAGSVFAAFVNFGVPANHLISASVMSAPAALAVSKLFYPETKKSKQTSKDVVHMEKSPERNIFEAISSGASNSAKLIANIAVNLIAFLALLEFVNQTLRWIGIRVSLQPPDYPYLTFELICSYVFWPLAFMMGADAQHSRQLAELIGLKTFANEFVAYRRLGVMLDNTKAHLRYLEQYNLTDLAIGNPRYDAAIRHSFDDIIHRYDSLTLRYGIMDHRTLVIATYALCGFSNFGSIGIMIGTLTAMAPRRKSDIAEVAFRAMIAGNVACFMTACIAGLMYEPPEVILGT